MSSRRSVFFFASFFLSPCSLKKFSLSLSLSQLRAFRHANRAWKVGSIKRAVDAYGGLVLWIDAENKITGELVEMRRAIKEKKLIAESLQASIGEWTHKGMLK